GPRVDVEAVEPADRRPLAERLAEAADEGVTGPQARHLLGDAERGRGRAGAGAAEGDEAVGARLIAVDPAELVGDQGEGAAGEDEGGAQVGAAAEEELAEERVAGPADPIDRAEEADAD